MPVYQLIPLVSAIWVLSLGLFVFFLVITGKDRSPATFLFSLFCFGTTFWMLGTFMMFRSTNDADAIFWDRFLYIAAIFNPILLYHFGRSFVGITEKKWVLYLGYALAIFFLVASRTDYFVADLYKYTWGVHTKAQILHHPFLVYFIIYVNLFFLIIVKGLKAASGIKKIQLKYIFAALLIMSIVGFPAFFPAYGISLFPFSYLSGAIFAIITAYAITQHRFLAHALTTDILVLTILVFLVSPLIFPEFEIGKLGRFIFVTLICIFGFLLSRSVRKEVFYVDEIKKAYDELKVLDEAKSEFVSIASHQLRTPLSAIKGYISMILEGTYGELNTKTKKPLENVYRSNERLIKLVNNLLDLSRIEAGRIELEKEKTKVEDVITSAIDMLKIEAKKKDLYLKLEKPSEEIPLVLLDKQKISQAILNIIDNAIRYTETGGITARISKKNKISPRVLIEIKDTGAGMNQKEIADLFESFSRGSAGSRYWTEGTGLGLYVAQKFVKMHQGQIWAESDGEGQGSSFFIELPV